MKAAKQGAEALVYEQELDGQMFLVKERARKRYRIPQIDERLRKERTRQEAKLMREARGHGVLTPRIASTDDGSHKIVMEKVEGAVLKDKLKSAREAGIFFEVGRDVGRLHSAGIVHGDLTTSNMIVGKKGVVFIDFGLGMFSRRVEDMATDLSVLDESLRAAHTRLHDACWNSFVRGYKSGNHDSAAVFAQLEDIGSRARYKKRPDERTR